jgi:hypothetical protein
MFKRFVIGFVLGIGGAYYYLHYSEQAISDANQWMERSASHYRGDRDHELVNQATGAGPR